MKFEQKNATRYQITLHTYELATLIAAVRWIAEGAEGSLSPQAVNQMEAILDDYENASKHLAKADK